MRDRLNPGVQVVASFLLSVLILVTHSWKLNLSLALLSLICIALFRRTPWRHIVWLLLGLLFVAGVYFWAAYVHPNPEHVIDSAKDAVWFAALEMGSRIFALGAIGISLCVSIERNSFAASLIRQFRVPIPIAYSVLVAIHFLGLIQNSYRQAELALRMRGLSGLSARFRALLTMLVRLIRQSEYTAIAMEARGFSEERVQRINPSITKFDIAYVAMLACYVLGIFHFMLS